MCEDKRLDFIVETTHFKIVDLDWELINNCSRPNLLQYNSNGLVNPITFIVHERSNRDDTQKYGKYSGIENELFIHFQQQKIMLGKPMA